MTCLLTFATMGSASAQTTATVEWTGGDALRQFEIAAFLAGEDGTIIVPQTPTGEPWVLEDRWFLTRPGQTVFFADGVTVISKPATPDLPLEEQPFSDVFTHMINVRADRVSLIGEGAGATLKMHKDQFEDPALYVSSDFRHVLQIQGALNFLVDNLTFRDSGGDGIIVTRGFTPGSLDHSNGIIRDVHCDNNRRNGLSVTSTKSILIEDSLFTNSNGALPEAGLDLEPDNGTEFMEGVEVLRCGFKNNAGRDLEIALFNFHAPVGETTFDKQVDILVDKCWTNGSGDAGFHMSRTADVKRDSTGGFVEVSGPTEGQVIIRDTSIRNSLSYGIELKAMRQDGYPVIFENVIVIDTALTSGFPIGFTGFSQQGIGNVYFQDCQVVDCIDRPIIGLDEVAKLSGSFIGAATLNDVIGTLYVTSPFPIQTDLGDSLENVTLNLSSNLVQNFGFERRKYLWENLECEFTSDAHTGLLALKIPDDGVSQGVKQEVTNKLEPGAQYRLSAFTKGVGQAAVVTVTFQDAAGKTIACPGFLSETQDYAESEMIFDAPTEFTTAYVEVLRFCPGSDAFIDQIVLKRLLVSAP